MEQYNITKIKDYTDKASVTFEHEIQFNGCSYIVIFGKHINGGFVAIPNWNITTELANSGNLQYNAEKLENAGLDQATALTIAQHIKDALENI